MNNNRGNNRRRGRGNNNGRPQNGGQQLNRIDSRARGNAPQLLEKYRKLAQDAHLNGDRVQAEYYLQFADHYFRVIADTRRSQEDARARRDDRWQDNGEAAQRDEGDDSPEFSNESDFPAFDAPPVYTRREREDRVEQRQEAPRQDHQPRRVEEAGEPEVEPAAEAGEAPANIYEPVENPFLRENRGPRLPRGRRDDRRDDPRRPRRDDRAPRAPRIQVAAEMDGSGLEASLPPAISASPRKPAAPAAEEQDEAPVAAAPVKEKRTRAAAAPAPVEAPVAAPAEIAVEAEAAPAPKRRAPRRKAAAAPSESAE